MNYKDSGVDIEAGNSFVEKIKEKAPNIGGFNGMMKVPSEYENPVLVSGADGVGTKINIARILNDYTTIGIDLVAMCVNDVITCGAKPLYFLDYISTGKLEQVILSDIIDGIIKGCEVSEMDLLGGETAEHPKPTNAAGIWDLDLAGFCTGVVEEDKIIDGSRIKAGDKIIGIESSGVHSNGYSLINDMIWRQKIYLKDAPELITPTTIYAPLVKQLLKEVDILGMAHITGGGIPENLPRCLPEGLTVDVDYNSWPRPQIFEMIAKYGTVVEEEMRSIFNLGIGYCVVVSNSEVDNTQSIIERNGLRSWVIGKVK
jgi:phosphoribosylformylglycinamidine cyclo-ligase